LGRPIEKRQFRYADMLYPDGRRQDQWAATRSDARRPPAGDEDLVLCPGGVVPEPGLRGDLPTSAAEISERATVPDLGKLARRCSTMD